MTGKGLGMTPSSRKVKKVHMNIWFVKTITGKKEGFVGLIVVLLTATDGHFAVHGDGYA
jgi:hypothetical protein